MKSYMEGCIGRINPEDLVDDDDDDDDDESVPEGGEGIGGVGGWSAGQGNGTVPPALIG